MIGFLNGIIVRIQGDRCWVSVSGIGYIVCIGGRLAAVVTNNQPITLWIESMVHDAQEHFFGFIDQDEQTWFQWLVAVSGVGGRVAMNILSGLPPHHLARVLRQGDIMALREIEGVGPKLANRLVTELKDRALSWLPQDVLGLETIQPQGMGVPQGKTLLHQDAILALVALGYRPREAEAAVIRVAAQNPSNQSLATIITQCLPLLSSV
jgi:Holliday junction DNA helicase RuvA